MRRRRGHLRRFNNLGPRPEREPMIEAMAIAIAQEDQRKIAEGYHRLFVPRILPPGQ